MISPIEAFALSRVLAGLPLSVDLDCLKAPYKVWAGHLEEISAETRKIAFHAFLAGRLDADPIRRAIADQDPNGEPPDQESLPIRPATVADLEGSDECRWVWEGFIPAGQLAGIAGFEGTGKTRFALDLCRRAYQGEAMPDGSPSPFPKGTTSLWVCSDGQQSEIRATLQAFGLPPEALYFNTPSHEPYGGTELDSVEDRQRLEDFINQVKPGLVFVDSLTNATNQDTCTSTGNKALMAPLRDIAQRTQTPIVCLLHLAKDGDVLGKRAKGIIRVIMLLELPDPKQRTRLRLGVSKSFSKVPPELGVTMTDAGNIYDADPPPVPLPSKGGRPAVSREKAIAFIRDELTRENDQTWNRLKLAWEAKSEDPRRFQDAVKSMESEGKLVKDGGTGMGKELILHLTPED